MKMFKRLMVVLFMLAAATGAQANTYVLGNLAPGLNNFGSNPVSGSFVDRLYFNLDTQAAGGFGVGALNYTVGGAPIRNINFLDMALFDSNNNYLDSGFDFVVPALNAGTYYLEVSGIATGLNGGIYAGGINLLPVPEPGVTSMLLSGLAILVLMGYRRREFH